MTTSAASVLVIHPGLQYAHQLAWALNDAELLMRFCSGVPVKDASGGYPSYVPKRFERKLKQTGIPRPRLEHVPWSPLLYRALGRAGRIGPAFDALPQMADRLFDIRMAARVRQLRPQAVVAYENAALHTFRAAKSIGATCILDAASFHHGLGGQLNPKPGSRLGDLVNHWKDQEVELADHILTCSDLAAQSYKIAGVAPAKVHAEPLGADLPDIASTWRPHEAPLHFVFAGALSKRKGIDFILDAVSDLHREGLHLRVSFVGGLAESEWLPRIRQCAGTNYLPSLPQKDLFEHFARSDCLLLPSRYDSFGMVVAEAMACGLPAIVSSQVGAKMMIESQPGCGWIVQPDSEALKTCMRNLILDRAQLFAARPAARRAAANQSWAAYRQRVARRIKGWLP